MTTQDISSIIGMIGGIVGIIGGTIGVLLVWIKYEHRLTVLEVEIKNVRKNTEEMKDLYKVLEGRHYEAMLHKVYDDKSSSPDVVAEAKSKKRG